jgi:D-sedoheptulose 7-phosphate isomerase
VEELFATAPDAATFARGYLDHLSSVLRDIDTDAVAAFIELLLDARERGARIFFIGNGGSASTASHFANDFAVGTRTWHKPFRAMSLTDNQAVLTAIGNDFGYERIFEIQLQTLMCEGDVVVAISASGNSENLLRAITYANENGATSVGLTGFDGGRLRGLAHLALHVPTSHGEYGPVEDAHLILDHLVANYLLLACRTRAGEALPA